MKKTRAKKFKVIMFYHLQNLFWGFLSRGFLSEGLCPGGFVLSPSRWEQVHKISSTLSKIIGDGGGGGGGGNSTSA